MSLSAFVDPDVRQELEELARAEDCSMSAEVRLAWREHIDAAREEVPS
ncbi:MAG TPA: hypothetical protein VFU26_14215 [Gaiellaceae bacterium]|nr:hypothetical protein [Gaiellaceae bacterium]